MSTDRGEVRKLTELDFGIVLTNLIDVFWFGRRVEGCRVALDTPRYPLFYS